MTLEALSVTFNNGLKCPIVGLGTWKSKPGEVKQAVCDAIDAGYRHLDCAHAYQNEHEVGLAIKEKIDQGVIKREELFVTSKLWNTFHKKDMVEQAIKITLKELGLDYLDLYLIHWPMGYKDGTELFPRDSEGKLIYSETHFLETWKGMEGLVKAGLAKSIGVSNFNWDQVKEIVSMAEIKPVTNQVESHIYLNQTKLRDACKKEGIVLTAYSPLGSPDRPPIFASDLEPPLKHPKVQEIANKHNKSPAQILIRFQIERGLIVIPKSVTKSRIISNIDVFDFAFTSEELKALEALDCNGRLLTLEWDKNHKDYPFNTEF